MNKKPKIYTIAPQIHYSGKTHSYKNTTEFHFPILILLKKGKKHHRRFSFDIKLTKNNIVYIHQEDTHQQISFYIFQLTSEHYAKQTE